METQEKNNTQESPEDKKKIYDGMHAGNRKYDHRIFGGGFLGPVILFGGILLLLTTFGLASKDVWQYVWPFWPVFLVLAGLRIVLGVNWIFSVLIAVATSVIFYGIAVYALIQVNSPVVSKIYAPQGLVNFVAGLRR